MLRLLPKAPGGPWCLVQPLLVEISNQSLPACRKVWGMQREPLAQPESWTQLPFCPQFPGGNPGLPIVPLPAGLLCPHVPGTLAREPASRACLRPPLFLTPGCSVRTELYSAVPCGRWCSGAPGPLFYSGVHSSWQVGVCTRPGDPLERISRPLDGARSCPGPAGR